MLLPTDRRGRRFKMNDFEEIRRVYDSLQNISEIYDIDIFKTWISKTGDNFITVRLRRRM